MKNYYDLLGLNLDADSASIKAAYRKLSKKFHPDLNPNDSFFDKMFKDLNEAKDVLSDKSSKHNYDKILNLHLNRFENASTTIEDIERRVKKEFDELLNKKEKEIKRKYTTDQFKKEELKLKEEKENEKQKIIIRELKDEFNKLRIEEKDIKLGRNRINAELEKLSKRQEVIVTRKTEIEEIINPDKIRPNPIDNNPKEVNHKSKLNLGPNLVKTLDNIKQHVDLHKREIFLKSLLSYCSFKSMSAKFTLDNPDLTEMILSSKFDNHEFAQVYKRQGDSTEKKTAFENAVFNYISEKE